MNLPKLFESKDIVYHYTKSITALEYVLYDKKIRLSPRMNSIDPIESMKISFSKGLVAMSEEEMKYIEKRTWQNAMEIENDLIGNFKKAKQVCFCMNEDEEKYRGHFIKPFEYFGCMKPRMWDQYADNYSGVCLVFSLNKILEKLPTDYMHDRVDYVEYQILRDNHNRIDLNELLYNEELYRKVYREKLKKILFRKHKDYSGEREYRICSFSDNEYDFLDISEALIGIVESNRNSAFFSSHFSEYADRNGIEYMQVLWSNDGVTISNPKAFSDLISGIAEEKSEE